MIADFESSRCLWGINLIINKKPVIDEVTGFLLIICKEQSVQQRSLLESNV